MLCKPPELMGWSGAAWWSVASAGVGDRSTREKDTLGGGGVAGDLSPGGRDPASLCIGVVMAEHNCGSPRCRRSVCYIGSAQDEHRESRKGRCMD
ncbi:hypothetical protein NDU88_008351 [Pleurodeles waltl]|uniref:Secreted protein n=1 Tax=Pleurodeles waltl TaxID=8319 RepID=A0AAV7PRW2_PLEWA|nr:hypothetical protein NDU88_008351 [Pleurodeles waltl]